MHIQVPVQMCDPVTRFVHLYHTTPPKNIIKQTCVVQDLIAVLIREMVDSGNVRFRPSMSLIFIFVEHDFFFGRVVRWWSLDPRHRFHRLKTASFQAVSASAIQYSSVAIACLARSGCVRASRNLGTLVVTGRLHKICPKIADFKVGVHL